MIDSRTPDPKSLRRGTRRDAYLDPAGLPPAAPLLVAAGLLFASACGTTVTGDGGEAGESEQTTGSSTEELCGTAGGPACEAGKACDPDLGCGVFGLACRRYAKDCSPVAEPRCEAEVIECNNGIISHSCGCSGDVRLGDCAGTADREAPDKERCSKGTFRCGSGECREHLDVCVDRAEGEPSCMSAASLGCGEHGIADCNCLEVSDAEHCTVAGPGQFSIGPKSPDSAENEQ